METINLNLTSEQVYWIIGTLEEMNESEFRIQLKNDLIKEVSNHLIKEVKNNK